MTGLIDTSNAPHYVWDKVCDAWRLLDQSDLTVIEERMPPGASETMHRHRMSTQLFYVLEGQLTFRLHDRIETVPPGKAFVVEPLIYHQARNEGETDTRFLVVSAPSTSQDREVA